jgi:uncharacterized protein
MTRSGDEHIRGLREPGRVCDDGSRGRVVITMCGAGYQEEGAMTEPHPNVVKFTRIVRAFNESDWDTITGLVSEDLRYHVAGGGILAGEYKGPFAFAEFLRKAKAETRNVITIDLKTMAAGDDHVWTYGVVRAERNGKRLESRNIYLYRFGLDGKLAEGMNVPVDQEGWTAFWS